MDVRIAFSNAQWTFLKWMAIMPLLIMNIFVLDVINASHSAQQMRYKHEWSCEFPDSSFSDSCQWIVTDDSPV
jgi:hypothetical protein